MIEKKEWIGQVHGLPERQEMMIELLFDIRDFLKKQVEKTKKEERR